MKICDSKSVLWLIKKLISDGYEPIGFGSTRLVLYKDDFVYKIDLDNAIHENNKEYLIYKSFNGIIENNGNFLKLAKCDIIYIEGFPILKMEYADRLSNKINFKAILNNFDFIDGCQVGINKEGDLVCYDYSRGIEFEYKHKPTNDFYYRIELSDLTSLGFVRDYEMQQHSFWTT